MEAKDPRKRNRKRHTDDDVAQEIRQLVRLGVKPLEVREKLLAEDRFKGRVPSYDTILRTRKDIEREDQSGTWVWTAKDIDPEMVRIVLDTLGEVNSQTGGRVQSFTNQMAERIYQIRAAFPKIPPMYAYMLAVTMTPDTGSRDGVDDVTGFLMYQPWMGEEQQRRYWEAVRQGWIPKGPPLAMVLGADGEVKVTDTRSALRSFFEEGGFSIDDEASDFTVGMPQERDDPNDR
jgi:hypothetical protein